MYITREDIKAAGSLAELTQLTNDIGGSTEPDWAVVDRAIAYACEIADGYLMGRYTLPLEPVPSILRPVCSDIARYWLHTRRINTAEFPKPLQAAYDNALKLLAQVRDGKLHLGVRADELASDTERPQAERGAYRVRGNAKQNWGGY